MSRCAKALWLLAACGPALAGGTRVWNEAAQDLARGRADGMATSTAGRIFLAPRITPLGGSQTPQGPVQVWAAVAAADGTVFLGSGPEGQILRVGLEGEPQLHHTVAEPLVTALALLPDGDLLAAAAPGGVIYRLAADGRGAAWADTGERYVWALAVAADGRVFAGTGERGRILVIDRSGHVETFYDTDEPHVVSLLSLGDGGLVAGGAGRGLVYLLDGEGHALVLHDDELPEVTALAAGDDGDLLAALLAPRRAASRRPALSLRLPDGVQVGSTDETVGALEEGSGPTLRGTIEGLAAEPAPAERAVVGRVVRIAADGTIEELWRSKNESPFCLARDAAGRLLFGTGEPARLYRVDRDGDVARLATLAEAQLTGLVPVGRRLLLSTSNPAAAYRLEGEPASSGSYLSRPFDAGGPARWGAIRWRVERPSGRTELYTRTGNNAEPDDTWSAWSPALTESAGSPVVNPDARFLQWRVRQSGSSDPATRVEAVTVHYEPYNRRPTVGDCEIEGEPRGRPAVRCHVADPDGDRLELRLDYRPAGAAAWAVAVAATTPEPSEGKGKRRLVWDTTAVAEGAYDVRIVASDQPANADGEGRSAVEPLARPVIVDRSPPRLALQMLDGRRATVVLEDAWSAIGRLELVEAGRVRFTVRPDDGLCDSPRESFRVTLPEASPAGRSLRGFDAAGNVVEEPWPGSPGTH